MSDASCSDERHLVVFDFFSLLTVGDTKQHEAVLWIQDPDDAPEERPGGAELAQLYRDLGYEILYVHMVPTGSERGVQIGGAPVNEAITGWLEQRGFPLEEGTRVWGWEWADPDADPNLDSSQALVAELVALTMEDDVELDFGYSGVNGRAEAFIAGGTPHEQVFTLGEATAIDGTTAIPGEDLEAHVDVVKATTKAPCEK